MYNRCEVCGKIVGHELNTFKRVDMPNTKLPNGKVIVGKKMYYHMSCYRKLFEDKK